MKKLRKVLALALALVMALSVTAISAFAEGKKQYTSYTFFGDSITAGAGLTSYYEFYYKDENGVTQGTAEGQRVRDTYPDLVAKEVGIDNGLENYYNESHSGWRTSEVREIFDETYVNDDGAVAKALATAMANGKAIAGPDELRDRVIEEVKQSDLITLALGSNDIQLPIIMTLYSVINPTASADYKAWYLESLLTKYGSMNEVINVLAQAVATVHGLEFALEQITSATLTGLNKFRTNYPVIVNKIREINPDADIYVVGLYNPLSDTKLSENLPIKVGKIIDPVILGMNLYLSTLNPSKRQYTYVDAFNTAVLGTINVSELIGSEGGLSAEGMGAYTLYVHPSYEGHAYIANQIIKAIPKATEARTEKDAAAVCNGLVNGPYGWALYKDDRVVTDANGIYRNDYGWWKTTDGYVTFDETDVARNDYGWWRVVNSKVDFDADGIYQNRYGWWKTTNGKVTFNENGIFRNQYGWWKVTNSKVDFSFNGIAKNQYGTWYVKNGKVDFNKNGKVKFDGATYKVTDGKAKLA